eukprot:CAMPEP_0172655484 /NCGR_PEP_ID=MMETSP1074-20121228/689_1 /TAXON_ID=2916 /ORGANISM="Ceratium fusus, Strain PA161109" /LENGTH=85 /DNA_ID=CAMNT_0013470125 /DNA_START=40 /DNA_END=297 /DNA_ORIENTATION=+
MQPYDMPKPQRWSAVSHLQGLPSLVTPSIASADAPSSDSPWRCSMQRQPTASASLPSILASPVQSRGTSHLGISHSSHSLLRSVV